MICFHLAEQLDYHSSKTNQTVECRKVVCNLKSAMSDEKFVDKIERRSKKKTCPKISDKTIKFQIL